jgi:DNA-binding protein WhiA
LGGEFLSFSSNVKQELSLRFGNARHCYIAELAAIINMCGDITIFHHKICIKIQTENAFIARKYFTLLQKTFNIRSEVSIRTGFQHKKSATYTIMLRDTSDNEKVLMATGILLHYDGRSVMDNKIYPVTVNSICCRRAYIRGAFLAAGSISDPKKNYHLEFVHSSLEYCNQLKEIINSFGLDAKIVERKEHFVIYIKEGEQIADLLNIMEAHVALLQFENVRVLKDMRNNVNRKVNCETANLNKTVNASVKQLEDIMYIQKKVGLHQLSPQLEEMARIRLQYPEASLKELGTLVVPNVGKSGVNHRLRKISSIAETIREGKGDCDD